MNLDLSLSKQTHNLNYLILGKAKTLSYSQVSDYMISDDRQTTIFRIFGIL